LAAAGFGSRRQCEEMIETGRVEIDGAVVTKLGTTVDPAASKVRVDGALLKPRRAVYYAVNKPIGFVTTNHDPQGRPRVVDLVPPDERVFPVGRLDRHSEGLILLTNDGLLTQQLTHPRYGVRKVYRVTVAGKVDPETMKQMRKGIHIAEGFVRVEGARLLRTRSRSTEMEITLREGKNREIRRILARLGHKVQQLRRIAVGPLRLGDLPTGAYRVVTPAEVEKLWRVAETSADEGGETAAEKPRQAKKPAGPAAASKPHRRPLNKKRPAGDRPGRKPGSGPSLAGPFSVDRPPTLGAVIGAEPARREPPDSPRQSRQGRPAKAGLEGTRRGIKRAAKRGPMRRKRKP
jgi:23S rRNA pseudouridine2605 synthase